ncbi:MAG: nucleotidyl transferase AbiEii/AbiGii toxin family protein [Nitrospirae bacterium]|nr:nucleotidyl transferase AbiEii/AbiGii toxin family protein [Nitrospirota bacterium]
MPLIESFRQTITFFEGLQKDGFIEEYALIGGLALSAWVRPRTTRDIDFVVAVSRKTDWSEIASVIETRLNKRVAVQKGTQRTNIKEKLSYAVGSLEVDVISTRGFDLAAEAIGQAVVAEVFDKKVKVVTPEYLILLKLLPLSGQDVLDIKALAKKADIDTVRSLAERHYLTPKLESVLGKKKEKK